MKNHIQGVITIGSSGTIIDIECQLSNSLPSIVIVGLGSKAVDEAKERIRSAFASSELKLPRKRIIINLAPADIPKESTGLDLPIAAAILSVSGQTRVPIRKDSVIIGEMGLTGIVRPVRGIIGKIMAAQKLGARHFFVPIGNVEQALLVPHITITPIQDLKELYCILNGSKAPYVRQGGGTVTYPVEGKQPTYLSHIAGQERAKRAIEISAAGGHNILLYGPPGTGKSMLAKSLQGILPALSHQEVLDVTHLHSLANNNYEGLVTSRPVRAPHHSSSHVSIVGGGATVRPGEITLSHRGVLILDEMPEFNRVTLEALRQPLEDKVISVARSKYAVEYPADFILVATANPCPCGFYGSSVTACICSPHQIGRYQQKLSGPILDRIDLYVEVSTVKHAQILEVASDQRADDATRARVAYARKVQNTRYKSPATNSCMSNDQIKKQAHLDTAARVMLDRAATQLCISARSYMRIIKVARTIADLEKSRLILESHVTEALQYRSLRLTPVV